MSEPGAFHTLLQYLEDGPTAGTSRPKGAWGIRRKACSRKETITWEGGRTPFYTQDEKRDRRYKTSQTDPAEYN